MKPSETMHSIGIVQDDDPTLRRPATPFDLPSQSMTAQSVIDALSKAAEQIAAVHPFRKGMGIAAPQIGIDHAAALVFPPAAAEPIILLNPVITSSSNETDEHYEGCLSFFDVRGMVPRALHITVQTTELDGTTSTRTYDHGLARLVAHEIDHLDGLLYTDRMRADVYPITVENYRGTGSNWTY